MTVPGRTFCSSASTAGRSLSSTTRWKLKALTRRGEIVELLARDLGDAGEQLVGDIGHLDRFVQPFAHGRHALRCALLESECLVVVFEVAGGKEQGGRCRKAGPQCQGRCKREL
jgi:hypothetical protein